MSGCQETLSNHGIGVVQVRLAFVQQHVQLQVHVLLQDDPKCFLCTMQRPN